MPLKLKVMLGPIAKYKQFGNLTYYHYFFRQIPLETIDLCCPNNPDLHAGDADD